MRHKKDHKLRHVADPGGQDSFLDIVSNVVGILIILVMLAGIRAQHSVAQPANSETTGAAAKPSLEAAYQTMQEKTASTARFRNEVENLQTQVEVIEEQYRRQGMEYADYFDLMTSLRSAIATAAASQGDAVRDKTEMQRQMAEINAELEQTEKTKKHLQQIRPRATLLENIPTPLGKTVEDKEIHVRLLGGRAVYVPFMELTEQLRRHVADDQNKYIKQRFGHGKVGPIDRFELEFLLSVFDVPMPNGIGTRIELRYAEVVPQSEPLGEPIETALHSPNSEFLKKLSRYRKDIYTVTVWVYPDSFDAYLLLKPFLQDRGYTVAVRPISLGSPISASPFGTKSTTQ